MDDIRQSVNLRAYGQRDPLVEYKKEALITFRVMLEKIKEDFYNFILHIDNLMLNVESERILRESEKKNQTLSLNQDEENLENKKVGRNDPCPCGSGKKVKKCNCLSFEYLRK